MLTRNLFAVANLVIEMERGYGDIAVVSRGLPAGVSMTTSHSLGVRDGFTAHGNTAVVETVSRLLPIVLLSVP